MAVEINGDGLITVDGTTSTQGRVRLKEDADNGTNYVELTAPASVTANRTITFPDDTGTVLTNSGNQTGVFSALTVNSNNISADNSLGFRNRIINADMRIDQRNAGASVTTSVLQSNTYVLDRWAYYNDVVSKRTIQQSSTAPAGFTNSMLVTVIATDTVGPQQYIRQPIEGFNTSDLGWGSANAKNCTLSFWVRSSVTGQMGGSIQNSATNRSYPFAYTINSANTWEYKTVSITGDTTGTWLTTNGTGLILLFENGPGYQASTAGAWTNLNSTTSTGSVNLCATNGATWYITGVQLEVGSVATPFERRPYGTEFQLCQRYLFAVKASEHNDTYCRFIQGDCEGTATFTSGYTLPVRMRVSPTLTTTGTASNYAIFSAGAVTACNSVPIVASGNPQTVCVTATVASGLTAGRGATLLANNNNTAYLYYGAEL